MSGISATLVLVRYRWVETTGSDMSISGLDGVGQAVTGLYGFAVIATAIFFLAWLSRSVDNIPHLTGSAPPVSSRWSIGWWFVPFANLVKPYQVVRDLHDRLATDQQDGGERLILAWWATFITVRIAFLTIGLTQASRTPADLQALLPALSALNFLDAGAAVLAMMIVRQIQARADERAQYIATRTNRHGTDT